MTDFLIDVTTLREHAREEIDKGPVTDAYGADLHRVLDVCNQALATELVCVLRYKRHYFTAQGLASAQVAPEFAEHAADEQAHADRIAARITQLGGEPDFNPQTLTTRSHSQYDASHSLLEMVREDLVAERIAIASYTEVINWLGDNDPTTRRMFEGILEQEEEHADDLRNFLQKMDP
ncbi:ferritin-like domain-containing protein [Candidatus Protofrankia californiensis]|uniref:ferritin-like domain-containing protein n=1 Tax=Candidatus Protofrankia californiensis TaxID=1839754 RepID=UPI0010413B79|nr:ferritin-like domain-containing protein [Candidatus Protofrankia californiensis]